MKLMRVGPAGQERPAVVDDDGVVRDLSPLVSDIDGRLLGDPVALHRTRRALARVRLPKVSAGTRIGAPLARPGKIVGIGLNYRDHAREAGTELPKEPVVFLKPSSSVVGPHDAIELPDGSAATDYEVELGVVLGGRLRRCSDPFQALQAVGGYVAVNDVTERALATAGPTWAKGKCCDTFTPVGPWVLTPDEVRDPQTLTLQLHVNGVLLQDGSTKAMALPVGQILCYLSSLMTMEPGDLVLTGTPGGVAMNRPDPKPFLRAGDVVELEVTGLGRQRTPVRA